MFYGWRIVAVTFLTHFISVGFLFYSYGAVFKALAADFGGSRLGVGIGLTVTQVVTALFSPVLGRMLDRGSIRAVMASGAALMALGFVALSRVDTLFGFYALLGSMVALGNAMMGGLPGSTLVSNWFIRRRGTALGIATIGISLSGFVMAPVATFLTEAVGWRNTFLFYSGLTALAIVPIWAVVVKRPEDLGLEPDGAVVPESAPRVEAPVRRALRTRDVLRTANFWIIALVISGNFCANGAILTHLIPHGTDIGYSPAEAAYVFSALAALATLGKPLFGWLTDHTSKRGGLWLATSLQAIGVFGILNVEGYWGLVATSAAFGLGMGGLVPLWGACLGAAFGRRAFGTVMGLMSLCMLPIQILGVPFAGWVFDEYGSYDLAFTTFLVIYALVFVMIGFIRLPAQEPV